MIYSVNTELAASLIKGALIDFEATNNTSHNRIVYLGAKEYSKEVKDAVEKSGFKFAFMDVNKK